MEAMGGSKMMLGFLHCHYMELDKLVEGDHELGLGQVVLEMPLRHLSEDVPPLRELYI